MSSLDGNVQRVLDVLIPKFEAHKTHSSNPIVLGISGLQGSGKSTWAAKLVETLDSKYGLHAITVSLDDFYHTHDNLIARRDQDPENKLYRTRGQPGTHDQQLARSTLSALRSWNTENTDGVAIPAFDKSRYNGEGDRAPRSAWPVCPRKPSIIVFEGWCLGFRSLNPSTLLAKHSAATALPPDPSPECILTLPSHAPAHLLEVNSYLQQYNESFMGQRHFDFVLHLDTEDLRNVYRWRLQQEHALWAAKGEGMSDEAVRSFVRGYMPAYEMYLEGLREGLFGEGRGRHVRVLLGRERVIERVEVL